MNAVFALQALHQTPIAHRYSLRKKNSYERCSIFFFVQRKRKIGLTYATNRFLDLSLHLSISTKHIITQIIKCINYVKSSLNKMLSTKKNHRFWKNKNSNKYRITSFHPHNIGKYKNTFSYRKILVRLMASVCYTAYMTNLKKEGHT